MPLNVLAWKNKIGLSYYFAGLCTMLMSNSDIWGYLYFIVRGNCWIYGRQTTAKAFTKDVFINQEQKLRDHR